MRVRRPVALTAMTAALFAFHCGEDGSARYSPESDDRFADSIVGAYATGAAGASGAVVTLLVCEDEDTSRACLVPTESATTGCRRQCHLIRGGGRGASESVDVGERAGCDCTTASAEMAVRAELVLADGSRLAMRGTVAVVPESGDPYGAPVALRVAAEGERPAPSLSGESRGGALILRLSSASRAPGAWPADAQSSQSSVGFRRTSGPEACAPAPGP